MAFTTIKVLFFAFAIAQVSWAQDPDGPDGPDGPDNNDLEKVIAEYEIKFQELLNHLSDVAEQQGRIVEEHISELESSHEKAQIAIDTTIGVLQGFVDEQGRLAEEEHRDIRHCTESFERFLAELNPKNVDVCRNREEDEKLQARIEEIQRLPAEIVLKKDDCLQNHNEPQELTHCFDGALDEGRQLGDKHADEIDGELNRIVRETDECIDGVTKHVKESLTDAEIEFVECSEKENNDGPNDGPDGPEN